MIYDFRTIRTQTAENSEQTGALLEIVRQQADQLQFQAVRLARMEQLLEAQSAANRQRERGDADVPDAYVQSTTMQNITEMLDVSLSAQLPTPMPSMGGAIDVPMCAYARPHGQE